MKVQRSEQEQVRALWDNILDMLLEQIGRKSIPLSELQHLVEELNQVLLASKGRRAIWGSVIDVILVLLKSDASIRDFRTQLPYAESTIYRALWRLESAGFAQARKGPELARVWTINSERCPVLFHASRFQRKKDL
jgi:hypothetical protein